MSVFVRNDTTVLKARDMEKCVPPPIRGREVWKYNRMKEIKPAKNEKASSDAKYSRNFISLLAIGPRIFETHEYTLSVTGLMNVLSSL